MIYKVQLCKLCIDAVLEKAQTPHPKYDLMHATLLLLACNKGSKCEQDDRHMCEKWFATP